MNIRNEMLVLDDVGTLSESDHTSLNSDSAQLSTVELVRRTRQLLVVDLGIDVHLPRRDL